METYMPERGGINPLGIILNRCFVLRQQQPKSQYKNHFTAKV